MNRNMKLDDKGTVYNKTGVSRLVQECLVKVVRISLVHIQCCGVLVFLSVIRFDSGICRTEV